MKLCPHGKAGEKCPYYVPYVLGFAGCTNMKRELLDIEWCGKTPKDCKGYPEKKVKNGRSNNNS